tara:strand:+ start:1211 stop:1435 length:225 start_codon:yes stop_codon:yes gene_type:complete
MFTAQIHGKWQSFGGVFFDSSAKLLNVFNKWLVEQLQLQATNKAFKRTNNSWLFVRASLILANYHLPLNVALCR